MSAEVYRCFCCSRISFLFNHEEKCSQRFQIYFYGCTFKDYDGTSAQNGNYQCLKIPLQ